MLDLTPDEVLTTTRTVRKRLDFEKPVERTLIEECLEIAFQAPNGSNMNNWHWVVVDDPATIREVARVYNEGLDSYIASLGDAVGENYMGSIIPRYEKLSESTQYLRDHIHESPALLLPLMGGRTDGANIFFQASTWGSIVQAIWSFMLALRARGLYYLLILLCVGVRHTRLDTRGRRLALGARFLCARRLRVLVQRAPTAARRGPLLSNHGLPLPAPALAKSVCGP